MDVEKGAYGVYHPDYNAHVYRDVRVSRSTTEPINRGHDDESIQFGSFTYDGLTLDRCTGMPIIQLSCTAPVQGLTGHFRNVSVIPATARRSQEVIDLGVGPILPDKELFKGVVHYLHDSSPVAAGGKALRVVSEKFPALMTGGDYRTIPGFTGKRVRAAEVEGVAFPDLPTRLLHVPQHGSGLPGMRRELMEAYMRKLLLGPILTMCAVICLAAVLTTATGLVGSSARAADAGGAGGRPRLGSPAFQPAADCPVGWRGDWTGRFPGATPPTEWGRRVKGITSRIKYQAGRPAGDPAADSHPLEYFTIKEWLVAGPFAIDDPAADIDKDFLGGEATVEPAADAKAGDATWKPLRAGIDTQSTHYHNEGTCGDLNVDFVYVYGNLPAGGMIKAPKSLDKKLAYAHTYVHSPDAGEVLLRINHSTAAIKVLLNGQAIPLKRGERGDPVKVSLRKGWNRLLVKAAGSEAAVPQGQNAWVSRWRFAAYLEPAGPVSYETRNVAWMTKMTGRSMSQPIVVGDRIFLGSGMTDLLCIDKKSGKVLWLRSNTPWDAMTDEQRAAIPDLKERVGPLVAKLDAANEDAVKAINAAVSPVGLTSDQQAALDKVLKAKADAERAVHLAIRSIDRTKFPPMYDNEVSASNATPVSDGHFVYWACGGGMKGPGAQVIACFDLDGKRVWSLHDPSLGSPEHGNHISPNLVDGMLVYAATGTLLAYDAKTGREVWRNHPDDWQNAGHGSNSPVAVTIGNAKAIVEMRYIHRASDGKVICPSNLDIWGILTPVVEGGVMYNPCRWHGFKDPVSFVGVKLPAGVAEGSKAQIAVDLDGKEATMPARVDGPIFMVASPLYVDGVVYSIEMGGGLAAVDTVGKKALYRVYLDGYTRFNRFLYGQAASPTLAGQNIYITDDAGYTQIIQPGPRLKVLHRNVIENVHVGGSGGNPGKQESFYTGAYFDGGRMYLRGEEYLYGIGQE